MGSVEFVDEKKVDQQGPRQFFSDPIGTPLEDYEAREDYEVCRELWLLHINVCCVPPDWGGLAHHFVAHACCFAGVGIPI